MPEMENNMICPILYFVHVLQVTSQKLESPIYLIIMTSNIITRTGINHHHHQQQRFIINIRNSPEKKDNIYGGVC